jgi:selenocysteine lyase/cysteine desulfurase
MMNNGTVGPMPEPVFNTLMKHFKVQVTNPYDFYNFFPQKRDDVRTQVARFLNAAPDEIILNRNTTEGMNLVANGLDFEPGDEVIISSHEHPAGYYPWKLQEKRHGIRVIEVPLGAPPESTEQIVTAFGSAISPRTRVISVSHTEYITGLIFPVRELCAIAHQRDILVVADSAHGVGMLDLDVHELDVDVLASSPYKWCGAPAGCGVLYVRREVQGRIWPQIIAAEWDSSSAGATKFEELGQRADPCIFGLGEAVDFQSIVGKERIERRVRTLGNHLRDGLRSIPGVRLHTSTDPYLNGGLTAFSIAGVDPERIVNYLREKYNIVIRTVGREEDDTLGVRASTHIYLSTAHVDLLLEGVDRLAAPTRREIQDVKEL